MPLPRKSQGRQRVEMKKMEKKSSRQVTFSKRRAGLFKKASELCTLCGAKVAVIVFSPGKKVFSFGHPSVEFVMNRYLGRTPSGMARLVDSHRDASIQDLNDKITQASSKLETVKNRADELERVRKANQAACWWETPVEDLNGVQMEELTTALLDLRDRLLHKIALAIKKEDKAKNKPKNDNLGRPNNVSAPSVNLGAFGPYGGGGVLVPINGGGPYNVAPPPAMDFRVNMMPILMPVVNNGFNGNDGFMMVPPGLNENNHHNTAPVFEYDNGHVVGGFQNLLFGNGNDDYAPQAFMEVGGGGYGCDGAEFGYQNPFGYGFF